MRESNLENMIINERSCFICRAKNDKKNLFRLVKDDEDNYIFDEKQNKDGRGYYLCKNHECLKRLSKHKKVKIDVNELLKILNSLKKREKDYYNILKSMKNSRELLFGMKMVMEGIENVYFIVIAENINEKNEKKLLQKIQELNIPYVYSETKEKLGNIFDKNEVSVVAIKNKEMAKGIIG